MVFLRDLKKGQMSKDAGASSRRQSGDLLERERDYARLVKLSPNLVEGAMGTAPKATKKELNRQLFEDAKKGDFASAEKALGKGADVDARDERRCTPLMAAATFGHAGIVRLLIENRADVNARCDEGETVLVIASYCGHVDIARLLIENHADVDMKSSNGITPLMAAAAYGRDDVIKLLIAVRADVDAEIGGWTASRFASEQGHTEALKLIEGAAVRKHTLDRRLIDAAEAGDKTRVENALEEGAGLEARNRFGRTAWMIADENGYTEIADLLKSRGADVNATSVGCRVPEFDSLTMPIPETLQAPAKKAHAAPAQIIDESDDPEIGIHHFAWLRRTLGALKHEITSYKPAIFTVGLFAGILASTIADRIHEYRAGEAAIVEKAPASGPNAHDQARESARAGKEPGVVAPIDKAPGHKTKAKLAAPRAQHMPAPKARRISLDEALKQGLHISNIDGRFVVDDEIVIEAKPDPHPAR